MNNPTPTDNALDELDEIEMSCECGNQWWGLDEHAKKQVIEWSDKRCNRARIDELEKLFTEDAKGGNYSEYFLGRIATLKGQV